MMYYPHNIHFLWSALCMEGRSAEADRRRQPGRRGAGRRDGQRDADARSIFCRRGCIRWRGFTSGTRSAKEKQPLAEFTFAIGHVALCPGTGLRCRRQGPPTPRSTSGKLVDIIAATPHDKLVMRHSALRLLRIAANELGATLDAKSGKPTRPWPGCKTRCCLQDGLLYDEPPPWYFPDAPEPGGAVARGRSARRRRNRLSRRSAAKSRQTAGRCTDSNGHCGPSIARTKPTGSTSASKKRGPARISSYRIRGGFKTSNRELDVCHC